MMESQFGSATNSILETLNELQLITTEMQQNPACIPARLRRLEGLQQMLAYYIMPRNGVDPLESPLIEDVKCHKCNKSWRAPDACILKIDGAWLCRDHHPSLKDGGIRPAGWQPPQAVRNKLDKDRRAALKALSRDQLKLVNSRTGG